MGRLTEAAAADGGASAASSAGSPPTPLPLSATYPGCTATMASSEEDGTNGGASEAGEEREAPSKRRRLGWAATAWLTFYNIAMTAGYVRPKSPRSASGPPPWCCPPILRAWGAGWVAGCARAGSAEVPAGLGSGVVAAHGTRAEAVGEGRRRRRVEWSGAG